MVDWLSSELATDLVPENFDRVSPKTSGSKIWAFTDRAASAAGRLAAEEKRVRTSPPIGVASNSWVLTLGYPAAVSANAPVPRKIVSDPTTQAATASAETDTTRAFLGMAPLQTS
jgi:hypothetical protein